ncbi:hypothetical protein [Burkholderia sp. Ac-20379]|uniref:hypothetical protein n=1 Tax=Burkholderia sp. Ac-20379 TaxID=2703900 RepID=UPI00197F13DC|nr:hypothetical protein [Burkholderia sp. Ac-20379]MBN3723664.1 hypothetical protein [Burkholderia sp. Ac-20379]
MLRKALFSLMLVAAATPGMSNGATPESAYSALAGIYDIQPRSVYGEMLAHRKLYLAFTGDDVTGFFDNPYPQPDDADVDNTCRFFLSGKMTSGNRMDLVATEFDSSTPTSQIALTKQHDGTWRVAVDGPRGHAADLPNCAVPSMVSGDVVKLADPRPWQIVGKIGTAKAPLYSEPSADKQTRAYLIESDPVAIQITQGEWTQIDYIGKHRELVRWARSSDLYYYLNR